MSKRVDDTFADRLKKACETAGVPWSPTKLGYLVKENKQTVSNWMNNGMLPRADTLFRLTDALGCDPRWLATGEGMPPVAASQYDLAAVKNDTLHRPEVNKSHRRDKKIKKS